MFLLLLLLFLVGWLVYQYVSFRREVATYPPGPPPVPFFGNTLTLDFQHLHIELQRLQKEYGSVFTVWIPYPHVIIMDYKDIKEALVVKGEDFTGRPQGFPNNLFSNPDENNSGVIMSYGDVWREQRRTAIHILRDFGMGKNLMEEQVKVSIEEFLEHMKDQDKERIDLRWPIQMMVANIINQTLFGYQYKYDKNERIKKFVQTFCDEIEDTQKNISIFFVMKFPWMRHLPYIGYKACGKYKEWNEPLWQMIDEDIARSLEGYDVRNEPECFMQAYQQKIEANPALNATNMRATCMDFFIAGTETTSTTLRWAVLFLAQNQHIQDEMREEILAVCGTDRLPCMSDKPRLPLSTAGVMEVQRMANLLPINVTRVATKDVDVDGVKIPEGAYVIAQIHNVLSASPVFENPDEFNPRRFLNRDGTFNKEVVEQLIPFSLGRRQCAGEGLARVELFLGLTAIIQHYRIQPAEGEVLDLSPVLGGILAPKPNLLKLTPVAET